MFAVLLSSLFNVAMLIGLAAGIVTGVWRARQAAADALAFDPLGEVRVRAPAARRARWTPA